MKIIPKWLIAPLIILLCGNIGVSQSISKEYLIPMSTACKDSVWIESNINIEMRKHGGVGFFYPYNLPDANCNALAAFRTYNVPINCGFAIIEVTNTIKDLKTLIGRVKFSGSDIDQTKDTLIIAAHYSKTKDSLLLGSLNKGQIPDNANVVKISDPLAQFENFHINPSETINKEERKYLIIQLVIKSGSDDNFYYGESHAVVDDLHLVASQ